MTQTTVNGGLQYIRNDVTQRIYLDFDGASTSYNGEILHIGSVAVRASELSADRIEKILSQLNTQYASRGVVFVSTPPVSGEYSTIFVGKTDAFQNYGSFAGLAETIDSGNQNKSDNAFVLMDAGDPDEKITAVISHETEHLLGTLSHAGPGLTAYGDIVWYFNETFSGTLRNSTLQLWHNSITYSKTSNYQSHTSYGYQSAVNATVGSGGILYISSGGVAEQTTVTDYGRIFVYSAGSVTNATVQSGGEVRIFEGGALAGAEIKSNGRVYLSSGTTASNTVISGGLMEVEENASVCTAAISDGGQLTVSSGGQISSATIQTDGRLILQQDAVARDTVVSSGGSMQINEGSAINTTFHAGGEVFFGAGESYLSGTFVSSGARLQIKNALLDTVTLEEETKTILTSGGKITAGDVHGVLTVESYGFLENTVISASGVVYVLSMAEAQNITVDASGNLFVGIAGFVSGITLNDGMVHVATGGSITDIDISGSGKLYLYGGALLNGEININGTVILDDLTINNGNVNFVLPESTSSPMVSHMSRLEGGSYSVSIGNAPVGEYLLAGHAENFSDSIEVRDSDGCSAGSLQAGEFMTLNDILYFLHNRENDLTFEIFLQTYKQTASWYREAEEQTFTVEFSFDNFETAFRITLSADKLDNYLSAQSTLQWRIALDGNSWFTSGDLVFEAGTELAEKIFSDADGDMDLFFASSAGRWSADYQAQHQGFFQGWTGTQETVRLEGKNILADVFLGSTDANMLLLTDDAWGDALFIDDMFSAFPENDQQVRLGQINEIRCGAGDDIVDMTSQLFTYTGNTLSIYGGEGNDVIWGSSSANLLFGDDGDDRIVGGSADDILIGGSGDDILHGGGGNDIFIFGENWGNDTVEQLDSGTVTLWFENDSGTWDQITRTYTSETNTVTVAGTAAVLFRFGETAAAPTGAFSAAVSGKIFE